MLVSGFHSLCCDLQGADKSLIFFHKPSNNRGTRAHSARIMPFTVQLVMCSIRKSFDAKEEKQSFPSAKYPSARSRRVIAEILNERLVKEISQYFIVCFTYHLTVWRRLPVLLSRHRSPHRCRLHSRDRLRLRLHLWLPLHLRVPHHSRLRRRRCRRCYRHFQNPLPHCLTHFFLQWHL